MALEKGYRQVLQPSQNDVTFNAEGEELLLLTNYQGGTWSLDIIAPDGDDIPLTTFTSKGQQRWAVPARTRIRLHGGTQGARAYVGTIIRDSAGRLL